MTPAEPTVAVEPTPDGGWHVRLPPAPGVPGVSPDLVAAVERLIAAVETGAPLPLAVGIPRAGELLGVGRTYMWGLVQSGEIATIRVGRRRLVRTADLVRWVREVPAS